MTFPRTLLFTALSLLAFFNSFSLSAQSCSGNVLNDASGYYGGFEAGNQSISAGRGATDLSFGSAHGAYQVVSDASKPWEDIDGGGYLPLTPQSGTFMMLIHTSADRLWYKPVAVTPGQTYLFCAAIASAKPKPATGFEVRLRVKYGTTTTVIGSAIAKQGVWSQVCGSFTVPAGVSAVEFQLVDPYPSAGVSNFLALDDICIRNAQLLNPDVNVTYTGVQVSGNTAINDAAFINATYGTPVPRSGNPSLATITMNASGSYTFLAQVPGVYNYNVPVCAAGQTVGCPVSLLTITVSQKAITNPPVANTDFAETKQKTAVSLPTLSNDAAGSIGGSLNPASVAIIVTPKNGNATINTTTGAITYVPNENFAGRDTLYYRVCDKATTASCATAIQIITVKPTGATNTTNAADDYVTTPLNTPVAGNVKSNDSDPEGNTQTITPQTTTVAGKGTLVLGANGSFTFTPATNYSGPVSFAYTTCDNGTLQACAKATLYILVQPFTSMTPLPVTLVSFAARAEGEAVRLTWETGTENASSHFVVEHSTDGQNWASINTVAAAGTSNNTQSYAAVHTTPANGLNYYRLQVVDTDGRTRASNIVTVRTAGAKTRIGAGYPNPFTSRLQLSVTTTATARMTTQLFDINGQMVQQTESVLAAGENRVLISNLEGLHAGTYFLKTTVNGEATTEKLFKK